MGCAVSSDIVYAKDGLTVTKRNSTYSYDNEKIYRVSRCSLDYESEEYPLTGWISRRGSLYHVYRIPLRDLLSGGYITCIRAFHTDLYVYATWDSEGSIVDGPVSILNFPTRADRHMKQFYSENVERYNGRVKHQKISTRDKVVDFSIGVDARERDISMKDIVTSIERHTFDMNPYIRAGYAPYWKYEYIDHRGCVYYYTHDILCRAPSYDRDTGMLYYNTRAREDGRKKTV